MAEKLVGAVSHFFRKIGVAGIELTGELAVGDWIHVVGHTTDLEQQVSSMELDHQPIEVGVAGQGVGVKVIDRVRRGDRVYKKVG